MNGSLRRADQYDDPTFDYERYWEGREYEDEAEKMALGRLLEGKHFKRALDVGGGFGRISVLLEHYAEAVTLVDPSADQLARAESYLHGHPAVERVQGTAAELPCPDNSMDLVTFIRVMHHVPDPSVELREIARVLKPDGMAIIEVANYAHARNRVRHILHHQKMPDNPVDIRSLAHKNPEEIAFVNHNPRTVVKQLREAGLSVNRILSVSNLRSQTLKKIMPKRMMLAIEGILQPTLAHGYFGPSVFFLVEKLQK